MEELIKLINLETIGNYSLQSPLGGGKAAVAFLYQHLENRSDKIVVKFLVCPRNDLELQLFTNEAETLETLKRFKTHSEFPELVIPFGSHPNFPVHYFGIQYIEGKLLSNWFETDPLPWKWERVTMLVYRMIRAYSSFGMISVIHKDIHPGNILTRTENLDARPHFTHNFSECNQSDPMVSFIDFGLSNRAFAFHPKHTELEKNRLLGAFGALSPEYVLGDRYNVTQKSDIWALGLLFYQMLTGSYPVPANSIGELIQRYNDKFQINFEEASLSQVPFQILHTLKKMLEYDPSMRWDCAEIEATIRFFFLGTIDSETDFQEFLDNLILPPNGPPDHLY